MDLVTTETNSGDDSRGQAFGLDGNLYLVAVIAIMAGLGIALGLGLVLRVNWAVAVVLGALPVIGAVVWIALFKVGKPAGYTVDRIEQSFSGGHFSRNGSLKTGVRK